MIWERLTSNEYIWYQIKDNEKTKEIASLSTKCRRPMSAISKTYNFNLSVLTCSLLSLYIFLEQQFLNFLFLGPFYTLKTMFTWVKYINHYHTRNENW